MICNWITHHDWCRLTLKGNSLMARRWFLHQKTKLGQWGIKSNIFLRTEGFVTMSKIMSNIVSYNSGALRHLTVGLKFKIFFIQLMNIYFLIDIQILTLSPTLTLIFEVIKRGLQYYSMKTGGKGGCIVLTSFNPWFF